MGNIKILLVDDHTIFRSGFTKLLADSGDFEVAAEAGDIAQALYCLERLDDLAMLILDINLAGQNALEQIPLLRTVRPLIPILVMSMYPADQFAAAAYRAGANGYLTKDASPQELFEALETLAGGNSYRHRSLDPSEGESGRSGYPHDRLSERELEILKLIANGDSLTDIGSKMYLSVKTVSTYRARLLEKLGLSNNAELIKYALTHGLTVV